MIIKLKVSQCRTQWLGNFPSIDREQEQLISSKDGDFDEAEARRYLSKAEDASGCRTIDFSSGDNKQTIAFVTELLCQMRAVSERIAAAGDNDVHIDMREYSKIDQKLHERMKSDRFVFVKIRVDTVSGGILRYRIQVDDPHDCGSVAMQSAVELAVYVTRIVNYIKREIEARHDGKLCVIIGEIGEHGIIARANKLDADEKIEDLRKEREAGRAKCPNRVSTKGAWDYDFCSPANPNCPFGCYSCGKCLSVKI